MTQSLQATNSQRRKINEKIARNNQYTRAKKYKRTMQNTNKHQNNKNYI